MPGREVKHDDWCEARRFGAAEPTHWAQCSCADRAYEADPFVMDDEPVLRDFSR